MRIQSCHIGAFGRFHDLSLDDLDQPVVVIHGDNEAGKTSFFHFLRSMLYGIYPTDADKHPYQPRSGRPMEGEMVVRVDEAEPATVSRRLRSSPQGTLDRNGETVDLRNRTLPAAQHVPQSVFESVYALQLDDLIRLEGAAWDEVQDRLLGSLSVDHIRPARVVIEELASEATDLWRTDNRGKPVAKQLARHRRDLREQARDARERDRRIRSLSADIEELDAAVEALTQEKVTLTARQNKAERLVPVRRLLKKIEALQAEAGDLSAYASIPEDPRHLLDTLRTQRADLAVSRSEKRERLQKLEREAGAPTDDDETVLEHASQIRGWGKRAEVLQNRQQQAAQARHQVDEAQRHLDAAGGVLDGGWQERFADAVRQLSLADLRTRIRNYDAAAQAARDARATAETLDMQAGAGASLGIWIGVATFGAVMSLLTYWFPMPIAGLPAVGAVIVMVGVWQTVVAQQKNETLTAQREALELERKESEAAARAASVKNLVAELPLPPARTDRPGTDLVEDLRMLKNALETRDERREEATRTEAAVEQAVTKVRELATTCGLSETAAAGEMPDVISELEQRLDAAETRRAAADEARADLPDLRDTLAQLDERHEDLDQRLTAVTSLLREVGREADESHNADIEAVDDREADEALVERGIDALDRRRTARDRAQMALDTLHSEYPDWEARRDEIRKLDAKENSAFSDAENSALSDADDAMDAGPASWAFSDDERARMAQRLDEVGEELEEKKVRREGLRKDLEHLLDEPTVAEIESELANVERRLDDVRRERDRLMLLAGIVRKADADFRRKHQPDVIRRASAIISAVTGGRYERLELQDDGQRLVTFPGDSAFPVPVGPPLSQGTLDQIYLAIRLAIVDHLDDGRDPLPLFLDEVFVNWDRDRRQGAFDVLAEMADRRQLFFFTCHPYFAREVATHLNGALVDLDNHVEG